MGATAGLFGGPFVEITVPAFALIGGLVGAWGWTEYATPVIRPQLDGK
jgi:hypothetical protein